MNKKLLLSRIRDLSGAMDPDPTREDAELAGFDAVQCVAFDFYGTMFISGVGDIGVDESAGRESLQLFEEALRDSGFEIEAEAAEIGLQTFDRAIREYQKIHRSKRVDYPEPDIVLIWYEVLERLSDKGHIRGELSRDTARRFSVEYEFRFNPVWPMPGLNRVLDRLASERFILGIISNSQFYTPLAFEALTGRDLAEAGFDTDLTVWSYQASVKKPSIHFYRRFETALQQKHKMRPEQVLYVGNDMLKDIKPASELGMKTALFAGDARSLKLRNDDPSCKDVAPDVVITRLDQLAECLET